MTSERRAAIRALVAREIAAIETVRLAFARTPAERVERQAAVARAAVAAHDAELDVTSTPRGAEALAWAASQAAPQAQDAIAAVIARMQTGASTPLVDSSQAAALARADAARASATARRGA